MTPRAIRPVRSAFTLIELLVVISIFVLVLAIGVPAFSSLLYTSDQSLSENALRQGLAGARDAAARSPAGRDAAAVFFYDQERLSIVVCGWAGVIDDFDPVNNTTLRREVFAPIPGMNPVQLPRLWMVRGYAPQGRLDGVHWYERTHGGLNPTQRNAHWLFPETSFFDLDVGNDGPDRQTFMVRFEGGTGKLRTTDPAAVLVLSPSPSSTFRGLNPWNNFRADREADPGRFVRRVIAAPITAAQRSDLIGGASSDTVLAKPLGQLAIYNERRLAGALGARLNDATGCLYQATPDPAYVLITGVPNVPDTIDRWIEDRAASGAKSDARIFSIHPHLGWLQELTGSRP